MVLELDTREARIGADERQSLCSSSDFLKIFPDEVKSRIQAATFSEEQLRVIFSLDGYNLSQQEIDEISRQLREFLCNYVDAHNAIVIRADEILGRHSSLSSILDERKRFMDSMREPNVSPASDGSDRNCTFLEKVNSYIVDCIRRMAAQQDEHGVTIRAYDLAVIVAEMKERQSRLRMRVEAKREKLQSHAKLMREAYEFAKDVEAGNKENPYSYARNSFEIAFLWLLDKKLQENGYIPPVFMIHDVDGNLTPARDSNKKPGYILGRCIDILDTIHITPPYQRVVLADNAYHPMMFSDQGRALFRDAGAQQQVCVDAQSSIKATERLINHIFLTANMTPYAEGIIDRLGLSDKPIILGMEYDSCSSRKKADRVAEFVLDCPDGVFIVVDDNDSSLSDAIKRGNIFDEHVGQNIPPEFLFFFVSRVAGDGEVGHSFHMEDALNVRRVLHGVNQTQRTTEGLFGYQGMTRLAEIFMQWREERIEQGWLEATPQRDVNERIRKIVENLPHEIDSLREKILRERSEKYRLLEDSGPSSKLFSELALIQAKLEALEGENPLLNMEFIRFLIDRYHEYICGISLDSQLRGIYACPVPKLVDR